MPEKLFCLSKIFFILAWIVHTGTILYSLIKVVTQETNWVENANNLFDAQKKLKSTAFLLHFFIILISIWSFKINDKDCFVCLSRWYRYNAIVGSIFLITYLIVIIMSLVYKTDKYYDQNAKTFLKKSILKTFLSIIICFFMSNLLMPKKGLFITQVEFMKIWDVLK